MGLRHSLSALVYGHTGLHSQLESSEGVRQGDPFSAFAFALSVQPLYEAALAGFIESHGVSILDDLTLVGPQEQVFAHSIGFSAWQLTII